MHTAPLSSPASGAPLPLPLCEPRDVGLCAERLQRAEDLVARFIEEGRLPGAVTLVARRGRIAHLRTQGWSDIAGKVPMAVDSLFRIYSMTKIFNAVSVLTLYERGLLDLNDPIARYLPGFTGLRVAMPDGSRVPARRDPTIYDLLRYCAGLAMPPNSDAMRKQPQTLADIALEWSTRDLIAQPGEKWIYGVANDILARIVEVVSGTPYDKYLNDTIFRPLGLVDTGYSVDDARAARLTHCYHLARAGGLTVQDGNGPESPYRVRPTLCGGGSGLVSSTLDYFRLAAMLLGRGEFRGDVAGVPAAVRILGRKTVELMTTDHLPAEHPNLEIGTQCFRFGLGVSVVTDVARSRCLSSLGDFGWGGAAGTQVWMNPEEEMVVMIMIQVRADVPTGIMDVYKRLIYQAIVD
ncbi:hypothetical protein DB346_02150 [Verrucomicrobia bacterium LW23]|nr:hypothetical protein DB346_02150 [Verrucomicrobia bacterium LW23]